MASELRTRTSRGEYVVECQRATCGFWRDSGNRNADRMAGRRHAAETGHIVRAVSTRIAYFEAVSTPAQSRGTE